MKLHQDSTVEFPIAPIISGSSTSTGSFGSAHIADKVSIGLTNPNNELEIKFDTDKHMVFSDSQGEVGNCPSIHTTNTAGSALVDFGIRADNILLATGNAERMRVTDDGVGIGTSSPVNGLHVKDGNILIEKDSDTAGHQAILYFKADSQDTAARRKGAIIFQRRNSYGVGDMYFCVDAAADGGDAGTGDAIMYLSGSGNVGIGTAAPANLLTVYANDTSNTYDESDNYDTPGASIVIQNTVTSNTTADLFFSHLGAGSSTSRISSIRTGTGDTNLAFITADNSGGRTEKMRITDTGNVGIGVTDPDALLEVGPDSNSRGIVKVTSTSAAKGAFVTFYGNNAESAYIGYEGGSEIVSSGVQGDLVLRNVLSAKDIILTTNSGNVGINNLTPTQTLDVTGTIQASGNISGSSLSTGSFGAISVGLDYADNYQGAKSIYTKGYIDINGNGGLSFNDNTSTGYFYASNQAKISSGNNIRFDTYPGGGGYKERMRIIAQGNVGIGTDSPNTGNNQQWLSVRSGSQHGMDYITYGNLNNLPDGKTSHLRIWNNSLGYGEAGNVGLGFSPYSTKDYATIAFGWESSRLERSNFWIVSKVGRWSIFWCIGRMASF